MALDTHVKIEEMIANLAPASADGAMALTRQRPPPPHHSRGSRQKRPTSGSNARANADPSAPLRPLSSNDAIANGAPASMQRDARTAPSGADAVADAGVFGDGSYSEEASPPPAPPRHSSLGFGVGAAQPEFDENTMAHVLAGGPVYPPGAPNSGAYATSVPSVGVGVGMQMRGTPPPVAPRPSLKSTKVVML